jgi:oxalate decarboxylase/phosphoglucose isomerase-like protein (cupin superfamily)
MADEPTTCEPAAAVVGPEDGDDRAGHDATPGTLVLVPPGAPHTFANVTDEPAVMLSTFTPDRYVRYFRDLRDMIAGGRALTPQANIEAMRRYATEPATDVNAGRRS